MPVITWTEGMCFIMIMMIVLTMRLVHFVSRGTGTGYIDKIDPNTSEVKNYIKLITNRTHTSAR